MILKDYQQAEQMNIAAGNCLHKGHYAEALAYFSKALELLPEESLAARATLYSNRGHTLVSLQRYEDALSSFRNSLEIFQQMGESSAMGEQLGNIGSVNRDIERWDESLDYYFKALNIFKEVDHEEGIADQYSNIGYTYSQKGDLKNAFQCFGEAEALYDKLGNIEKARLCGQNLQAIKPGIQE